MAVIIKNNNLIKNIKNRVLLVGKSETLHVSSSLVTFSRKSKQSCENIHYGSRRLYTKEIARTYTYLAFQYDTSTSGLDTKLDSFDRQHLSKDEAK